MPPQDVWFSTVGQRLRSGMLCVLPGTVTFSSPSLASCSQCESRLFVPRRLQLILADGTGLADMSWHSSRTSLLDDPALGYIGVYGGIHEMLGDIPPS